jgi:limonene-1,2-epoxide hydrolase
MSALKVVQDLMDTINRGDIEEMMNFFDESSYYEPLPVGKKEGLSKIRSILEGMLAMAESHEWIVHNSSEQGNVVFNERTDIFVINGKNVSIRCIGVFEVSGNIIKAWRSYYDQGQFDAQL